MSLNTSQIHALLGGLKALNIMVHPELGISPLSNIHNNVLIENYHREDKT
jgi:hypothetical protein